MSLSYIPLLDRYSFSWIRIERALVGVLAAVAAMTALRGAVVGAWGLEGVYTTTDRCRGEDG